MAKEPNVQECAKSMLEIFRSRNVASGESLMMSDLYIAFFSKGWSGADYAAAIQYAESQDWIRDEGAVIRLLGKPDLWRRGFGGNFTLSRAILPTSG